MRAVEPIVVNVLMTARAIVVVHQRLSRNPVAGRCASQRWLKVLIAFFRTSHIPAPRVLKLKVDHDADHGHRRQRNATTDIPFDAWTNQSMQPVQPNRRQWGNNMSPVDDRSRPRLFKIETKLASEQNTRYQHHDRNYKQRIADSNRASVATISSQPHVNETKHDYRRDQNHTQHEMRQKHVLVKQIFVDFAREMLCPSHNRQVDSVRTQQAEHRQHRHQQDTQPRPNDPRWFDFFGRFQQV